MHVLDANEILWTTSYTYDKIMEVWWRFWPDAFAVYFKLMKQARMQETNQTFTLNSFLEEFFWWGHKRVSVAKWILKQLWLIDDVVVRDELWKIKAHYVRVNYLIDENKVRNACSTYSLSTSPQTQGVGSATCGWMATNALSTQQWNALNTQQENIYIPEEENKPVKNTLAVPGEKKEKSSAKKERKEIALALPTEEYKFVDDFIDINNWQIRYQLKTNPDYFKKQYSAVDKLVSMWFSLTDIQTVLNYVKQDDFWSKNILSVEKLLRKNKEWVPYVIVMAEAIKNYRPKAIDLDALAKAKWLL